MIANAQPNCKLSVSWKKELKRSWPFIRSSCNRMGRPENSDLMDSDESSFETLTRIALLRRPIWLPLFLTSLSIYYNPCEPLTLLTKRKSSNLRCPSSQWSLHTSVHRIPRLRVARSSRFVAGGSVDTGDSVPLDRGGQFPMFRSMRRSLRCWPLPQLCWERYEISRRGVGSRRRWGREILRWSF